MVFESLVTDLINKYLGDFVENLDKSQLKLGIWGGDVVLNELDLKESALDDLDLPVKIKAGHVGNLTLKIPWKNLYSEPVIATIDGLYALAVPNVGIKYNAEKEEKEKQEAKQKKLQALEEAKKLEAEKDKPKEKKKDSFAEKFATQVIKNLQVEVRNIHVRFEDKYTNPKQPFSIGVSLKELLFRTTDENWKPCIIKEAVSQIYKLVKLESLAVYWNSRTELFEDKPKTEILKSLKSALAEENKANFQYLVKPISSVAHLKLNTKPELQEYSTPKIFLTIIFDEISVCLAKLQYNDVLEMLEGFERVSLMGIYKKYKPSVPLKGNIRTWWHYAYTSILEETVRRRRKMWSWSHMKEHRDTKNRYREAYIQKLESKKVSGDLQKKLDECEKYLDVFNITVIRQQAELEAAKRGAKRAEEKKNAGWFGGWLGGGSKKKAAGKEKGDMENIQEQFYEQFNAEEKKKLYDAIGYQENEADPTLPKEFVAVRLVTKLNNLSVMLKDDMKKEPQILKMQLKSVFASVGQRPAASAVKVDLKMDKFTLHGTQQGDFIPRMVTSITQTEATQQALSLLDVLFETNPLDGLCDSRVRVNTRPVQIIYDAITVNQMAEFFKPPKDIQLKQLSQAAMSKFDEIKEQSATGLQHAIDLKKYTEIAVDLQPSYVIVPHGGIWTKQKDVAKLVLDLGNLKIGTEKNQSDDSSEPKSPRSLEEVMLTAYDKFNIKLDRVQLLMAHAGEDWQKARSLSDSNMHILCPISISILLQKCMFDKDPRMAKMKVRGELPLLSLNMSDHRLQEILSLVQSIPLPESTPEEPADQFAEGPDMLPTVDVNENRIAKKVLIAEEESKKSPERSESMEFVNYTDLELEFVLNEISLNIAQRLKNEDVPLLRLAVNDLGTSVKVKTYDLSAEAFLGGIHVQYLKVNAEDTDSKYVKVSDDIASQLGESLFQVTDRGPVINLVNTPRPEGSNSKLLAVHFLKANTDGPEFATTYKKTEQSVNVEFSALELLLHQESILDLLVFAQSIQPPKLTETEQKATETKTETEEKAKVTKKKGFSKDPEVIDMSVKAALKMFSVTVCSDEKLITDVRIKGIEANVTLQERQTLVGAVLKDISVRDPSPATFYPNILEIQGSEVLALNLAIYNENTAGDRYEDMSNVDMKVEVSLGQIKVTFLNKYVTDLLGFLDNFQEAQKKIKEAGETLAEYSQDAVQNLQETASRLSLSVDMRAPIIYMPQNSTSYNILMVDLGHLSVKNAFEKPGQRSANGVPAVLDKMNVTLTDLKVSRAVVDASQYVKSEVELLQPAEISVDICRNIASSWFHAVPDVDISGKLKAIKLLISQGDFTAMMLVLNENLSEGQDKTKAVKDQPSEAEAVTKDVEAPVTAETAVATQSTPQAKQSEETWCKLKFNFCINSLSAALYNGDSQLTSGLYHHDDSKCLGQFELQLMGLDGHMMSSGDMDVKVILRDTIMDDKRLQKRGGITRMMERSKKSTSDRKEANMIDVSFKQEKNDKNIDVHMSSLYVCVCLDFLMSIADFFVKGLPKQPEVEPPPVQTKETQKADVQPKPEEPPAGEMSISVCIDRPEIIMIEDQSKEDTSALMLDMELMFRMRQSPETMDMSAAIKNLGIVSCKYNSRGSGAQILTPCDISFYSKTPKDQGAHMDVSTSDLILNISPATIKTMSAIAAGLSKQDEEGVEEEKMPGDIWQIKKLQDCDFWFLRTDDEDNALASEPLDLGATVDEVLEERGEQLCKEKMIVKVPSVVVKIEGGVGNRTVPLLITEMSFQGEVRDWSGKLYVESRLLLEVAYYNEKMSVWEPLLEPVFSEGKYRRWELGLEVMKNDDIELGPEDDEETDNVKLPPPKMTINVKSTDPLQLTMTKACLESLTNLGKAFGDAYALVEPTLKAGEVMTPYVIRNVTGEDLMLKLDNAFEIPPEASNGKIKLLFGDALPLKNKDGPKLRKQASVIKASHASDEKKMIFQVEKFNATREVTVKRAEKRLFHVDTKGGEQWAIVCDTQTSLGQRTVTFRSSVQVMNHLTVPVDVFFKDPSSGSMPVSSVSPEEIFSLPLHTIYTTSGQFMFKPIKEGCDELSDPVSWKGAENLGLKQLMCKASAGQQPFYFKVRAQIESVYYEGGDTLAAKSTTFHLYPTVVMHNLLPYKIRVMLEGTADAFELDRGCSIPLDHACVGKTNIEITIPDYQNMEWVGRRLLEVDIPELSVWTFEAYDKSKKITMDLGLHYKQGPGVLDVSVYSPYWMINKTDMLLKYKAGDDDQVDHAPDLKDVMMFSFKKNSLFSKKKDDTLDRKKDTSDRKKDTLERKKDAGKKQKVKEMKQSGKASLKIGEGDWSDKFSLDVVGSSGTVQSKNKTRTWEVGVSILLSNSGLTKIVTFTPYYMLVNTSPYPLLCKENHGDSQWIEIPSKECVPIWPLQTGKEITMQTKVKDTEISTSHFLFNKPHTTLLKLDNEYGGINVECQETESSVVTTLTNYKAGMATVLIINHTDKCDISYQQNGGGKPVHVMGPSMAGLYTWEDSLGKREMVWSCGEKKDVKNDLSQDGIGEVFYNSDTKVYWVSFLNGMQRVLLFTHDLALATIAQEAGELERIEQEINLNIHGMGLSLVNNYKQQEVAFLGITSSGIIWEEKRKRYKAFNLKNCQALEGAYQKYETEKLGGHTPPDQVRIDKMEVNFKEMMMFKPNKRMIRRSFQDGIWVQYKTSPHQVQFHAKINRVQLDNQVTGSVFPTVLSPMPPPKSVAAESVPKPFTEISMMLRKHEHSNLSQMKYFKVLIQEMQVKVDQGFLNNVLDLFSSDQEPSRDQEKQMLEDDIERTEKDLITTMGVSLASEQKMFYDYLHLSPIKVHLSFSLQGGGGGDGKPTQLHSNVINVFLQSVGVVLTDVQDVVFKLGFFERQHTFYNNKMLIGEMTTHYAGQAIKQMYVLVLGLDVLGNPFGLLRGMAEGLEDLFYEPYQGAIQGPEEFAEGLALGVRSLFGHAVGGAAGAVSRITGTLGKGLAALTLDDEYQKKRREAMNKRPANVGEGFARGGKGLVMGVFDGVTGIVRKPIEGAKKEGVEGFFKGVGKGLVGVVTRPTSGVVDFASSSFEGIKRIAENVGEIHRLRPPRRFHKDHVIRPYNEAEAAGFAILMETEKGKYFKTDDYVAHTVVTKDQKNVFLVTNKRVIFASRGEIFGQWNCEFTYMWSELKEKPKATAKGFELVLKEKEKKFLFGGSSSKKEIHIQDKKTVEYIIGKISEAWDAAK
ncbi:intermembrane lipid transfer protein VPS13A-like isoform X4 [Mercenaria mercenaria]|uniref:intermembrane lipid transfer protein VPS13A-like isoform X4 n=1 Tax=Mercenaria mercenaria TaxID=6596 RepID=UPI00234ED788|nr:intermembrane lipid transfer protein VPS13A-like isoform X4 [Mercenaria mercenaria]